MNLAEKLTQAIRIVPNFPKPGISFKDITPVLLDPDLVRECVLALAQPLKNQGITRVIGIESRGFLFGPMIAQELNCGFAIVRKKGKLPSETAEISYELEYGSATIEIHKDAMSAGDKVFIHDDLLATGGTAAAAAKLAQNLGAEVVGFGFLIGLDFLGGKQKLSEFSAPIYQILSYS
ncbi:MAG: adenine phosphoribosyltransferase [Bacteroidia bacterium]|nr:adenine phosphoribosyltransferase [Bacteroidia bacterium]